MADAKRCDSCGLVVEPNEIKYLEVLSEDTYKIYYDDKKGLKVQLKKEICQECCDKMLKLLNFEGSN